MFMNSGTRGNKINALVICFPPSTLSHKTRDTPRRVKQGGSKKSFGINSWHSLRKGEKTATKERAGKDSRVTEWCRRESIFGKRCCKNVRTPSGRKKEDWKDFSKVGCQVFLSKKIILGHPCIPRVRVNTER
jgi:hypothetical protein